MLRRLIDALFPVGRIRPEDRWTVFLLWLVGVLQGFAQSQASALVPFTRAALDLTEGDMSLVLAITRFTGIGAILFSLWGDKRGRRRPFLVAYVILILASAGTAFVTTPAQFTVMQSVVRLTTAAVGTLGVVLLAERVQPVIRAFAISLYGAGGSFGAGIGLTTLLIADLGPSAWRIPFALTAVGLIAVPLLFRRVDESPLFHADEVVAPMRELFTSRFARWFWISAIAATLAAAFSSVGLAFSTERLVADVGLTTAVAVLISLAGGGIGGLGFFVGGRMADVIGRRSTTVFALTAMLAGGIALYWLEQPWLLGLAVVGSTFGSFAYIPAAASHRIELFPTGFRSTAGAAGSYLAMVGSALGLLAGRYLIDRVGLSQTVTYLGLLVVVAILLTVLLPETLGQDLKDVSPDQ